MDCRDMDRREVLARIDTLRQRADTDPAVPIGQDDPPAPRGERLRAARQRVARWFGRNVGSILLVVFVASVVGAALLVHFRTYQPDLVLKPGRAVL